MKQLIHFTADWCLPCKRMKPVIDKFIDENKDIEYIKIDVDSDYRTAQLYNIQSVPTLVSKIDGKVHDRVSGLVSEFVVKSLFG